MSDQAIFCFVLFLLGAPLAAAEEFIVNLDNNSIISLEEVGTDYVYETRINDITIVFDMPNPDFEFSIAGYTGPIAIKATAKHPDHPHHSVSVSTRPAKSLSERTMLEGFWPLAQAYGGGRTDEVYQILSSLTDTIPENAPTSSRLNIAELHLDFRELIQSSNFITKILATSDLSQTEKLYALLLLADLQKLQSQQHKRLASLSEAMEIVTSNGNADVANMRWQALIMNEMCDSWIFIGDRNNGLRCLEEASSLAEPWPLISARVLNSTGGYHTELPYTLHKSISYFGEAESINARYGYLVGQAITQYNRGVLMSHQGDYQAALSLLFSAFDNVQRQNQPSLEGNIIAAIGGIYLYLEKFLHAHQFLTDGNQRLRFGEPGRSTYAIKSHLGIALRHLGDINKALELHEAYERYHREQVKSDSQWRLGLAYVDIASDYLAAQDFEAALTNNAKATELLLNEQSRHRATAAFNLAEIQYAQSQFQSAIESANAAMALHKPQDVVRPQHIKILNLQLAAAYQLRLWDEAEAYGQTAINYANRLLDSMAVSETQYLLRGSLNKVYTNLADVRIRKFQLDGNLEHLERVFEVLNQGRSKRSHALLVSRTDNEIESRILNALEDGDKVEAAKQRIQLDRVRFFTSRPGEDNISAVQTTLKELQATLRKDQLLIDYVFSDFSGYQLLISQTEIMVNRIRTEDEISVDVSRMLKSASDKKLNIELAKRLGQELIGDLTETVPEASNLLVTPVGPLNHLPVAALDISGSRFYTPLITDYGLSMNLGKGNSVRQPAFKDAQITIVSTAKKDTALETPFDSAIRSWSNNLKPLPWASKEVSILAEVFGPEKTTLLTGEDATLRNVKQQSTNILHFATHGYISRIDPDLVGIVLIKEGQNEQGFIGWRSFSNIQSSANLVFLNGCQTSSGQAVAGEGVLGLVRSFVNSGASNVIATRWDISDRAAFELTQEFYQRLIAGERIDQALRGAQLALLERPKFRNPYYWASHALYSTNDYKERL